MTLSRRAVLSLLGAAAAVPARAQAPSSAKVVVVGGGFAGATAARALRAGGVAVTLVEPKARYVACPMSNAVIAGLRPMEGQEFGYDAVRRAGVEVAASEAKAIDAEARRVTLADGAILPYDRLVMAPGIEVRLDAVPGYDAAAAEVMPHAWQAGPQTILLRDRLAALEDGGLVVMSAPANPYRCPPGPYERASLIAHYLKTRKPRSKLILLDAKDQFSKQRLFQAAWAEFYPQHLEYVPLASGGSLSSVDAKAGTVTTDFETYKAALATIIPPQRAAPIAVAAGVADRSGWCPVDPSTFESRVKSGIHVIGDAAIGGAVPKSAFAANAEAKVCATAILALLAGRTPAEARLVNTCYSLVAPDYGISIAGVYHPANGLLADVPNSGGMSPLDAPAETRTQEARYAEDWFRTITAEVFR